MRAHEDREAAIDGIGFSGIGRLELLQILQRHCVAAGVDLALERRLEDLSMFADHDLVVGADGANSIVREALRPHVAPSVSFLSNRYVWYGTTKRFDALTLTFRENPDGVFVAHHYPYADDRSTFIVECDAATWASANFERMSEEQSRRYCEAAFARDLDGHPLLTNRSLWITFKVVTNRRWHHRNAVLIGDALRTVHFSIGSGTRSALEDAIALHRAFAAKGDDVAAALAEFESTRRPGVERFLDVAARSYDWYERIREKMALEPMELAYDYVMRGGRISDDALAVRSPAFAAAWTSRRAAGRRGA